MIILVIVAVLGGLGLVCLGIAGLYRDRSGPFLPLFFAGVVLLAAAILIAALNSETLQQISTP